MGRRTQVTLTDEQYQRLKRESERTGLTVSELVRRAVDRTYRREPEREGMLRALEASFGAWKDRDFDGESYVEAIRGGTGRRLAKLMGRDADLDEDAPEGTPPR